MTYQIPFASDGSIPTYAAPRTTYTWRDPEPFEARLILVDFNRGRSAANFTMRNDVDGAIFVVFLVDFVEMVRNHRWRRGTITATFIPCKRGANYGVRLVDEPR